ncbi:MAG: T9SS type A sorting domain-containing protein [Candidatus Kapaibacterium sp.]
MSQEFYKVSAGTGTYTDLVDPVVVIGDPSQIVNEFSGYGITGPFAMEAFGQKLDFSKQPAPMIFAGGFIGIDVPAKQRLYVFDGFTSKLAWRDSTTSVSLTLEGNPGDQILKVQWKNMGLTGNPAGDFVNMQIWLRDKDNSYEVHVGPNHVTGKAGYFGNNGPAIGGFVSNYDFSVVDVALHLSGNPATPGVNLTPTSFYPIASTPPNGTVYRFAYVKPASVESDLAKMGAVSFRPNPCTDRSLIELPDALNGMRPTLTVHDLLGREMLRMNEVASGDYIDRGTLPAGVYYVTLHQGSRSYTGGTLVVSR